MDAFVQLEACNNAKSGIRNKHHHHHRYWIQDHRLMMMPLDQNPLNRTVQGMWGLHLDELRKARAKVGLGVPLVLRFHPIQAKRKRLQKKGKEKIREEEEEQQQPKTKRPGKARVVELPPELLERIAAMEMDILREPTINNRRFIRHRLLRGGSLAEAMGTVAMMQNWWRHNIDEMVFSGDAREAMEKYLGYMSVADAAIDIKQGMIEIAKTVSRVEFSRFWYPVMIRRYDLLRLRQLYIEYNAEGFQTGPIRLRTQGNSLKIMLETLRPRPYFRWLEPAAAVSTMLLDRELYRVISFYRQHYSRESSGMRRLNWILRELVPKEVILEIWDDPRNEVSLAEYHEYIKAINATDDEEELERILEEYGALSVFIQDTAGPLISSSLDAIRIIREIPKDGFMTRSDYVAFIRLVIYTTWVIADPDHATGSARYFDQYESLRQAISSIRVQVKPDLQKRGVKPWFERTDQVVEFIRREWRAQEGIKREEEEGSSTTPGDDGNQDA